ncbi:hypothetical protein [Streptomyces sp. SudanB52_2052]|uniref:hypothetical protein n=1 Tax=Streptomyces sp. SudanB52_2052 TaxID=3035276 RepID=UPI000AF477BB
MKQQGISGLELVERRGGKCARCSEPCKKYGSKANPLCRNCFAAVAAERGPGVRQKGCNA